MYLHENPAEMAQLVTAAAGHFSRAEAYVEKDYFAMMLLREATARNPSLVFKGGTCLSKCHHAIERFSEDVDLGLPDEHATEGMRKAMKRSVVGATEALGLQISNLGATRSRRDYNRYDVLLPEGCGDGLLIVETAAITPASPMGRKPVQSFVGEYCHLAGLQDVAAEYGLGPFEVNANSMERTFCDKVFALCDYYLAGDGLRRQSRHLYDLRKLQERIAFDDGLKALFATVRRQRAGKNRCLSADPGVDLPSVLRDLYDGAVYRSDYHEITTKLLYDEMGYDEAAEALVDVSHFLSGIDWGA